MKFDIEIELENGDSWYVPSSYPSRNLQRTKQGENKMNDKLTNDNGTYLFDTTKFNEIKSRMENNTDKLKEIRERIIEADGSIRISNFSRVFGSITAKIQSETYQLGRDEVIEEIKKQCEEYEPYINDDSYNGYQQFYETMCAIAGYAFSDKYNT